MVSIGPNLKRMTISDDTSYNYVAIT